MILNEHFIPLNEDLKFEALSQLREIQSNLVSISFLPVIAIMKQTNPLKKDVIEFQDELDALTIKIQEFISNVKNDLEFEDPNNPEGTEEEKPEDVEDIEDEELPPENDKEEKDKKSKDVEDTTIPKGEK